MISRSKDADTDRAATGIGGGAVDGALVPLPARSAALVPTGPAAPAAAPEPSLAERLLDGAGRASSRATSAASSARPTSSRGGCCPACASASCRRRRCRR
ncbi:hypothetical protein ACFQV8_14575 [Pseudonocardia benzenivorans]